MVLAPALHLVPGIVFIASGWPIRAGVAMIIASFLPQIWQAWFTNSAAPGFGFLLMLTLPLALLVTVLRR